MRACAPRMGVCRGNTGGLATRRPSRVERGEVVLPREGPGRRSACSGGLWRVSHGKDHGSSQEPAQATASMLKFTVYVPPASDLVPSRLRPPIPQIRASEAWHERWYVAKNKL